MAIDEYLLERIRRIMKEKNANYNEIKMFGGVGFMIDEKMCLGCSKTSLMVRVGPDDAPTFAEREHASLLMNGKRPMKGFVFVEPDGYDMDEDLDFWIQSSLDYNPFAPLSPKKKKK